MINISVISQFEVFRSQTSKNDLDGRKLAFHDAVLF